MPKIQLPLRLGRTFQVWSYDVSHSVLLLRSNRTGENSTRVDLMFRGVAELQVRSQMKELSIDLAEGKGPDAGGRYTFEVKDAGWRGYVVARALHFAEDDLSYGEPSTIDNRDVAAHVLSSGYWE
ncbi:MAG: hypothetical protein M3306_26425 [Actinomycetota bacterium]|nr:hypothetical protein [Actinomycetota bacterium]